MNIRLPVVAALGLALAGAAAGTASADTITKIVWTHTPMGTKVVRVTRHVPHRWLAPHLVRVFHPAHRVVVLRSFGPGRVVSQKIVRYGHGPYVRHAAWRATTVRTVITR